MRTALHLGWVLLLSVASVVVVHLLCQETVRCEERCGGELWFAAFTALFAGGLFGWRIVDMVSDRRRWR
jgi:hypothetical protein